MSVPQSDQIVVIAGLGHAVGTGAACARLFCAQLGCKVALISRPRQEADELQKELGESGGCAAVYNVAAYTPENLSDAFALVDRTWPDCRLSCAIWNAVEFSISPFLDMSSSDIQRSIQTNIVAASTFAQLAIRRFLAPLGAADPARAGTFHKGSLIFTGGTAALTGHMNLAAQAAGKHGLRAISQSVAREFGPRGVHAAFVIIGGTIDTRITRAALGDKHGPGWMDEEARTLAPQSVARTYLFLHEQDPGAWTLEMDLRPAKQEF